MARKGPSFVQTFHYILETPAYRALRPVERAALLEVQGLYRGDKTTVNDDVSGILSATRAPFASNG